MTTHFRQVPARHLISKFLGGQAHIWRHMKVPRPGIKSEPQLQQRRILNLLYLTGDRTPTSTATQATEVGFLNDCTTVATPN